MTHIGIDARLTAYRTGGISTYIRRLVESLENIDRDNEYTIFQSRREQDSLTQRLPTRNLMTPPHHRFERFALPFELRRHSLDVLHSPDFIPPRWGAKKYVITVHDLAFLLVPGHKDRASSRYYIGQIKWAVKRADHILAVSEATRQDLITLLDVPEDKITVQYHGVSESFYQMQFSIRNVLPSMTLKPGFILYVGTLEPRKNIDTLLLAYELMNDPPPLVLVGKFGWLFDETMARIQKLRDAGYRIIHRSDVNDDQTLAMYYNWASMLVLPSHYEGFGMTLLEAMACGTPVIASDVSAMPEIVGSAGLLVPPKDVDGWVAAMERVLTDYSWREQAVRLGMERAHDFTWENSANVAKAVYEKLQSS